MSFKNKENRREGDVGIDIGINMAATAKKESSHDASQAT